MSRLRWRSPNSGRLWGRSDDVGLRPSPEARPEGELSTEEGERRKARIERDALATIGERKVERLGCAHCGADEIVGWGRSHGLPRYRCKACGRTFNAATGTGMARLRKKDRWLDQAQAMIDGVSLAKAAERCGVHPTTAYRWRHRFLSAPAIDKPKTLQGIVEADETFILELFKGRRSGLARKARKRGGKARHPAAFSDNIPRSCGPRPFRRHDRRRPARGHGRTASPRRWPAPCRRQTCRLRRRPASARFARRAKIPVRVVPAPGKPLPGEPDIHINNVNAYHSRLKEWMRRFHGVATRNLPNYLGSPRSRSLRRTNRSTRLDARSPGPGS